jgi:transposase-like protein
VFEACYLWEEKMAQDHRRPVEEVVQEVLLDDPGFLKEIVERMLQQLLEAEMTEHIGAAPYERVEGHTGHRNGHRPRALLTGRRYLDMRDLEDQRREERPAEGVMLMKR